MKNDTVGLPPHLFTGLQPNASTSLSRVLGSYSGMNYDKCTVTEQTAYIAVDR